MKSDEYLRPALPGDHLLIVRQLISAIKPWQEHVGIAEEGTRRRFPETCTPSRNWPIPRYGYRATKASMSEATKVMRSRHSSGDKI